MRLRVCTIGSPFGRPCSPGDAVCRPKAGMASATTAPPTSSSATTGARRTRSTTAPQTRGSAPLSRRRATNGTRAAITRSPSFESRAGRTVSEPSIATATTRIVPVAIEANVLSPARYIPAMAVITVRPETSTDRPEVAAAAWSAACSSRPAARSSRSRRM